MLCGFHAWQNDKRPGAVHATYMVYGVKTMAYANGHSQHDGDVEMTSSSPDVEGAAEEVPVMTLSVVAEESLDGTTCCLIPLSCHPLSRCAEVLSQYETVTSIHVYSLGPHPVKVRHPLSSVACTALTEVPGSSTACGRLQAILGRAYR